MTSECPLFEDGGCEVANCDPETCRFKEQYEAYLPQEPESEKPPVAVVKPAPYSAQKPTPQSVSTHSSRVADKY